MLEEEARKRNATVRQYEEMTRILQDEVDVARQQLEEAARSERENAANELSFEEELANSDQDDAVKNRLTLEEQRRVIVQKNELVRCVCADVSPLPCRARLFACSAPLPEPPALLP